MPHWIDYSDWKDKRFGRLTVVETPVYKQSGRRAQIVCLCDCGSQVTKSASKLKGGQVNSCGCLKLNGPHLDKARARRLPRDIKHRNERFNSARGNAHTRELEFSLSLEDFDVLTQQPCHYCGGYSGFLGGPVKGWTGLDRVDSQQGYVLANVVPCCRTCNYAKNDLTYTEFLQWAERLAANLPTLNQSRIEY